MVCIISDSACDLVICEIVCRPEVTLVVEWVLNIRKSFTIRSTQKPREAGIPELFAACAVREGRGGGT